MITIKTKEEIKILKEGGAILNNILKRLGENVVPGAETGELESLALRLMKQAGGKPSFKGYQTTGSPKFPTALCTSINSEIVHAPALPSRKLKEGDILSIDLGIEYPISRSRRIINKYSKNGGFFTDMAKTFPVGKISKEAEALLRATEESLERAIKEVAPGKYLSDIGRAVQSFIEKRGYGVVRELVGHGVGYGVHEDPQVPNYKTGGEKDKIILKPGMVIAIEPMVTIGDWRIKVGSDGLSILTKDNSLSAHFEHTVAVTENGHEILTK